MTSTQLTELVLADQCSVKEALEKLEIEVKRIEGVDNPKEAFKVRCCIRLVKRYGQFLSRQASGKDVVACLRNYMVFYSRRVHVSERFVSQLGKHFSSFLVHIDQDGFLSCQTELNELVNQGIDLSAVYWKTDVASTNPEAAMGDGLLRKLTKYKFYRSQEQKAAVYAALNLPEGHTLMASLPTGAGKSLITQLLAVNSQGLTLVIVPTVALIIDQLRAARIALGCMDDPEMVVSYLGGQNSKNLINKLADQKIRLLFISPEAVMRNNNINNAITAAAVNGYLKNIVVDEAHLIPEWGDFFRPDFQCFSILRNKLLIESGEKIRTFLLSATVTNEAIEILKNMYGKANKWFELRAEQLRKEPRFCHITCNSLIDRISIAKKIISLLPRPMICYVLSPVDALNWKEKFEQDGFKRLEVFSSDTSDAERERIIKAWNDDDVDLIIATSAFGMGVDKPDVRSVIHFCMPEGPNRYYQELGRGGRDGLPSLSLLCVVPREDAKAARSLIKSKVITAEKAYKRWLGMTVGKTAHLTEGNRYWVDTQAKPIDLAEDTETGKKNIQWNVNVLLFLARAGYINLHNIVFYQNSYSLEAELLDLTLATNYREFEKRFEKDRQKERARIDDAFRYMARLVYRPKVACWADTFHQMYPLATQNCGGCPTHNTENYSPERSHIHAPLVASEEQLHISPQLLLRLGTLNDYLVYWPELDPLSKNNIESLLNRSDELGIRSVVFTKQLTSNILSWTEVWGSSCQFFSSNEFINWHRRQPFLLSHSVLCVFGADSGENSRLYDACKYLVEKRYARVIYYASPNTFIWHENRRLEDLVEGYCGPIHSL